MASTTLTSKGQITVPKAIRVQMGVSAGDRLAFVLMEDGHYALVPETQSVMSLKGILRGSSICVSIDAMDDAVVAEAVE